MSPGPTTSLRPGAASADKVGSAASDASAWTATSRTTSGVMSTMRKPSAFWSGLAPRRISPAVGPLAGSVAQPAASADSARTSDARAERKVGMEAAIILGGAGPPRPGPPAVANTPTYRRRARGAINPRSGDQAARSCSRWWTSDASSTESKNTSAPP